jgi:hypothetical protein
MARGVFYFFYFPRVKTAEGSFGDQFFSEDHGDDATLTEDAVPGFSASLKLVMSIGLDFLEIGETSRYGTAIDTRTSQSALTVPSRPSAHTQGTYNCPLIS